MVTHFDENFNAEKSSAIDFVLFLLVMITIENNVSRPSLSSIREAVELLCAIYMFEKEKERSPAAAAASLCLL